MGKVTHNNEFSRDKKLKLYHDSTKYLADVLVNLSDKKDELNCSQDTYRHLNRGIGNMIRGSLKKYDKLQYLPKDYKETYSEISDLFNSGSFSPPEERTEAQKQFVKKSVNGLKQVMEKYTESEELSSHLPKDYKRPGTRADDKQSLNR